MQVSSYLLGRRSLFKCSVLALFCLLVLSVCPVPLRWGEEKQNIHGRRDRTLYITPGATRDAHVFAILEQRCNILQSQPDPIAVTCSQHSLHLPSFEGGQVISSWCQNESSTNPALAAAVPSVTDPVCLEGSAAGK